MNDTGLEARLLALHRELKQATEDAKRQGEALVAFSEAESERIKAAEQCEWLAQVYQSISQSPWWWALLPRSMRVKRERRRLKQAQIFDSDAYLRTYPDVGAEKMDPLRHYILHGFGEGRRLTR